jgi:hypothetical protein
MKKREREKKTILFTDKIMCVKAEKKGKNSALTIIYLVVIITKEKKESRFSLSPFFSSPSLSVSFIAALFFLLAGKRSNNDE